MTEEKLRGLALGLAAKLRQPFTGDSWDVTILAFARELAAEARSETVEEVCKLLWHRHVECRLIRAAFAGKERGE